MNPPQGDDKPPDARGPGGPISDPDVFVAYADADRPWVHGYLLPALTEAGVRYFTLDDEAVGIPVLESMSRGIERAQRVVLVISPAFVAGGAQEIVGLMAQHYGVEHATWPVVPMILRETTLPLRLQMLNPLHAETPEDARAALERLCASLGKTLATEHIVPACPYPGMRPFGDAELRHFHGRDEEIEDVVQRVRVSPYVFVIGASGSGKSSLVQAGVLPRERSRGRAVVATRPGTDPLASADAAVSQLAEAGRSGEGALLFVDQLEEVFTHDDASSAVAHTTYWDRLKNALRPADKMIATVRADFYPQLMSSPMWDLVRHYRFELLPLRSDQLQSAIVKPSENVGVYIEAALVERLVQDADAQPGALPFVQETLVLLWERLHYRYLPLSSYQALVMSRRDYAETPRTGLQVAMANRADAVMAGLPSDDARRLARRIFLRLVQFGDGREDVRRQQPRGALLSVGDDELFSVTLDQLVSAHLLTASGEPEEPETLIDLSHEALIVGWPALRDWIDQRREAEGKRRALDAVARAWVDHGRGSGGLLDEVELREATTWMGSSDAEELGVGDDVADLIAASEKSIDSARRRRQRTVRIMASLSACLAVLLAVSVWLGLAANTQRGRAERERAAAQSGELALTTETLPVQQFDLALLLSQEAIRLQSTPRSQGSLLSALGAAPRLERSASFASTLTAVAATPDGKKIAVGDLKGTVTVLDAASLTVALGPLTIPGEVHALAFSPDGAVLAASTDSGAVRQWQMSDPTHHLSTPQGDDSVRTVSYSANGRWFAMGDVNGKVTLLDRHSGSVRVLSGHRDWVDAVTFTHHTNLLISAGGRTEHRSRDGRIFVRDAGSGRVVRVLPDQGDAVRALAVSPDDRTLAAAGADGKIRLWTLKTGGMRTLPHPHQDRAYAVAYSADGRSLASSGRDGQVLVQDVRSGKLSMPPLLGHGTAVRSIALVGQTEDLASVGYDGRLLLWDTGPTSHISRLGSRVDPTTRPVRAVATDGAHHLLATGDDDGTVTIRRLPDMAVVSRFDLKDLVWGMAFGRDGVLVTTTASGKVQSWDALSGRSLAGPVETGDTSSVVAVSPNGTRIATGGVNQVVRLWDSSLNPIATSPEKHDDQIMALSFLPDGRILSAGFDSELWRWSGAAGSDGRLAGTEIGAGNAAFRSLAVSPDGTTAATGDTDGAILFWDTRGQGEDPGGLPTLVGHVGEVRAMSYDVAGDRLLSADDKGQVRIWATVPAFREIGILGTGPAALTGVVAGERFVVGTSEGAVTWPISVDSWRDYGCRLAGRNLRPTEVSEFLGTSTYNPTCPGLVEPPQPQSPLPRSGG